MIRSAWTRHKMSNPRAWMEERVSREHPMALGHSSPLLGSLDPQNTETPSKKGGLEGNKDQV